MMNTLRIYLQALRVGVRDWHFFWTWKSWLGGWMMRLFCSVLMWAMMGRLMQSPDTLSYLLIGNAVTAGVGTFSMAASSWERMDGIYPLQVAAPCSLAPLLLGRTSIWMFGWIVSALIAFVLVWFAFDMHFAWQGVVLLPLLITIVCFSTLFHAVFIGALVSLAPQMRNIANNWLLIAYAAICGINVPVEFWPRWVQFIAAGFPITHGLHAIRLALAGAPLTDVARHAGLEIAVGLVWLTLMVLTVDRLADRARATGSIDYA